MRNFILVFTLVVFLWGNSFPQEKSQENNINLENFLPDVSDIPGWQIDGEAEKVSGQDLYLAINGGAEIYLEYGFKSAIYQTYVNAEENYINLEIYEMQSNAAAFGMYSFKRSVNGSTLQLGFEGCLDSYYLNFWQGNFLVTLTSMKTDSSYIDELINVAKAVDNKINTSSSPPKLIKLLPVENLLSNGITYLKGNLAFFNQDLFNTRYNFGIKEGIVGNYPEHKILIIKYEDELESKSRFDSTEKFFKKSKSFHNFKKFDSYFEMSNDKEESIAIELFQNFILVILGKNSLNSSKYIHSIEENIKIFNQSG